MFKGKKQREIEATLTQLLLPYQPESPITGPYAVSINLYFPPTKAQTSSKAKRDFFESGNEAPHTAKPDLDNFSKGFVDELVRLCFITDDKEVIDLHLSKRISNNSGIEVEIIGSQT